MSINLFAYYKNQHIYKPKKYINMYKIIFKQQLAMTYINRSLPKNLNRNDFHSITAGSQYM